MGSLPREACRRGSSSTICCRLPMQIRVAMDAAAIPLPPIRGPRDPQLEMRLAQQTCTHLAHVMSQPCPVWGREKERKGW